MQKQTNNHKLREQIRQLIAFYAFEDEDRQESVNTLTQPQILSFFPMEAIPLYLVREEQGEVLRDSRGNGSWQRPNIIEK